MADINLISIEELESWADLTNQLLSVASNNVGLSKSFTLGQLKQWLHNNPNLVNPTATTPPVGNDSTAIATTEYVQNELSNIGLTPATISSYGTVRTNSNDPVPTVYLKSEVDNFNSTPRSITTGGTGANSAVNARTNLGAAKSGSNNDITSLTALTSVPTVVSDAIVGIIPVGTIMLWSGSTAPSGWMLCQGQTVSRTTLAALFSVIGTTFGNGDNSGSTFSLPNLQGRFPMGAGTSPVSTVRTRGDIGGSENFTLGVTHMPSHNHGGSTSSTNTDHVHTGITSSEGSHQHSYTMGYNTNVPGNGAQGKLDPGSAANTFFTNFAGNHSHAFTTNGMNQNASHTHTISSQGGGAAFSIMNPFLVLNYVIKV